jgi:predicted TIM-barrel fold metal-dependent hydrolase
MMIDMHAHWRPQALADAMRKRTTPPMIVKMANGGEALDNGKQRIPIDGMFDDMDARLKSMDRYGISTAVLSLFGQLQWIERLPVAESLPLCRAHNDALAALCEKHPGRFAGYASLPLQNMEVAAMEFARALSLTGIVGAVLPGNAFLSLKNATEYEPIMEIADQYKAMIFIHWGPRPGDQWPRVPTDIEGMNVRNGTVDMQSSLSSDMVTLCWTDYLDRYPNATVHIHNLGGNFPFEVERMDHRRYMDTPDLPLPSSRVKKPNLYVDCNSFGPRAIEMGVELYGAEKIMFATDGTDFSTEWSKKAIADARLNETQRREILYDNAARLLGKLTQLAPPMEMRQAAE